MIWMNMKMKTNKILILIFIAVVGSFCCVSRNLIYHENIKEVQTPYGPFKFRDDSTSFILLDWFSQKTGDYRIDSINTRVIVEVCKIADGALSEMMGEYCLKDFENKPECIVNIFNEGIYDSINEYIDFIAMELVEKEHVYPYYESQFRLLESKLENDWAELPLLPSIKEFLSIVKERYDYWLTQDI